MSSAHTNDEIRSLQQQLAPQLAAHSDAILLNRALFARIQTLFDQRQELPLEPEALRLLEQYRLDFVRAGAALTESEQDRECGRLTPRWQPCRRYTARMSE